MLASGGVALLIDQWTKKLVQTHVSNNPIFWGRVLRIRYLSNQREIYTRDGALAALVLIWLMAVVSAIVLHHPQARYFAV